MRYTDANDDGEIANYYGGTRMVKEILGQDSYYPFGLTHTNYNSMIAKYKRDEENDTKSKPDLDVLENLDYQYKYQVYQENCTAILEDTARSAERQDELGLNWDSFKWRNYDYALGRFMSVDPLAEKYAYNSTYAFQENKMGLGRELEGLELISWDDLKDAGNYVVDVGTGIVEIINTDLANIESGINTFENNILEGNFGEALDQVARANSAGFGMQKVSTESGETLVISDGKTIGKAIGSILPVVVLKKKKVTAVKSANIQKAAQQCISKSQLGLSVKPKIHIVSRPITKEQEMLQEISIVQTRNLSNTLAIKIKKHIITLQEMERN